MIDIKTLKFLQEIKDSNYLELKSNLLFHSNKIEGSTFDFIELTRLLNHNTVSGEHDYEDVIETKNSNELFDFTIKTLGEPVTHQYVREMNQLLKRGTRQGLNGLTGVYKTIPNAVGRVEVAQPYEVPGLMDELLSRKISTFEDIVKFHHDFEKIHPFVDGNGRVGRMLMMKQCVENDIVIPLLNSTNDLDYYEALQVADSGDFSKLNQLFEQFQVDMKELKCYQTIDGFDYSVAYSNKYTEMELE